MSINNGSIIAPVSISDIASLIGASSFDLGTLCKHQNINKWAIYKPESHRKLDVLSLENDRKPNHMGLSPVELPAMKETAGGVVSISIASAEDSIREWYYQKPTGGSSSPLRISDFINPEKPESLGYNHDAVAPDSDWKDVEMAKPSQSSSLTVLVSNFSFRSTEDSAANIGSANSNFLPLSYLFSTAEMKNMYIGVAIYLPDKNGFMFASGKVSIGDANSTNRGDVFPNLSTNEYLRDQLTGNEYTFIPCLLYNPQTARVQEQAQRTYITMTMGKVYCMPSGAKSFKIKFNTAIKNSSKTFVYNGVTVTGYYLSGTYSISTPAGGSRLAYLIKGYNVNATGKTLGGWFITTIPVAYANYGFYVYQIIVIYARTNGDSNVLTYDQAPSESISVNEYLYCQYLVDIAPGANTRYVQYGYTLNTGTISNTNKVTASTSNGSMSFYGYIADEAQVGLTVDCVR